LDAGEGESEHQSAPLLYILANTEVPRNADTPIYLKKEQRINDRLQDKISILKSQIQAAEANKQNAPAITKDSSVNSILRKSKESDIGKKDKEVKKESLLGLLASEEGKESRIVHNNWIINNQVLKETGLKNQKQPSSKSVIVVKPNHALQPTEQTASRSSVRKAGSERKP
jgi:hypothetical protein